MIYKIDNKLKELEIELPLDEKVFHSKFIREYKKFKDSTIDGTLEADKEEILKEDENLCLLFDELHEIEEEKEKEPIEEPTQNKDNQVLNILKDKTNFTYPELEALGVDLKQLAFKFRFKGYVFQKRFLIKEYTIIQKP